MAGTPKGSKKGSRRADARPAARPVAGHGRGTTRAPGYSLSLDEERELPRTQVGYPPQHLLLTVLADYGPPVGVMVPSGALVAILAEFAVTTAGARAAIGRLARRGLLVPSKSGRNTAYSMTPRCAALVEEGRYLTYRFTGSVEEWDGRWTVVAYSINEAQRSLRPLLRTRLRWLGFAPLQDGLWVSPDQPGPALDQVLAEVPPTQCAVFVGDPVAGKQRQWPLEAWDLAATRKAFDAFVREFEPQRARLERGAIAPAAALVSRTKLVYRWFQIANDHAQLPAELLPANWPGAKARALFCDLVDDLGPLAAARVAHLVGKFAPGVATQIKALTMDDVLA